MPFRRKPAAERKPYAKGAPYANDSIWKFWKRHPNEIALDRRQPPGPKWGKDPLGVAGFSARKRKP